MEKPITQTNPRRLRSLSILALLILACGILLSAFHYHEEGIIFDDCPACRYQDSGVTSISIETDTVSCPLLMTHREIIVEFEISYTTTSRPFKTLPNAPPDKETA